MSEHKAEPVDWEAVARLQAAERHDDEIRVPSTWTALAVEVGRLHAASQAARDPFDQADQWEMYVETANHLADLIIDQRAR